MPTSSESSARLSPVDAPSLAPEPVVFQVGVEGVLKAFRKRFTPGVMAGLRALDIDPAALQPGYSIEAWEGLVKLVAAELWPLLPAEESWQTMGREFMDGYLDTVIGRAALAMGKVIGPRRLMERMGRNFRSGGNYLDVQCLVRSANEVELSIRIADAFLPRLAGRPTVMTRYRAGVLTGSLEAIGTKGVVVELLSWDPARQEARYLTRWRD